MQLRTSLPNDGKNEIFPKDSFLILVLSLHTVCVAHTRRCWLIRRFWIPASKDLVGWRLKRQTRGDAEGDIWHYREKHKKLKNIFLRRVNKKRLTGDAGGDIWQYWSCRLSPPSGIRNNVCLTMERHPWRRTKKIPPFSRITTTIYCRLDPGLTVMHDNLN